MTKLSSLVILSCCAALVGCAESKSDETSVVDYTAVPYNCVASWTNLDTGAVREIPSPCKDKSKNVCIGVSIVGDNFTVWAEPCVENDSAVMSCSSIDNTTHCVVSPSAATRYNSNS